MIPRRRRRQKAGWMRKKGHFGKLISIGNKSLQTAEGGAGVEGMEKREGGREGEQKFRGIKILSFQGKKEKQRAEQTDRSKSLPRHPLHAMVMLPSPVSVNTHNKRN